MTFKVIRGQDQGRKMTSVPYRDYFFICIPWLTEDFYIMFLCDYQGVSIAFQQKILYQQPSLQVEAFRCDVDLIPADMSSSYLFSENNSDTYIHT